MDGTKLSILVVDDEANLRRSLRSTLEAEGFAVLDAESAEKALEVLAAEPVDLALFDIRLPGMDGLALLDTAGATDSKRDLVAAGGSVPVEARSLVILSRPADR